MQRIDLTGSLSFSRLVYGMWRLADDTNTSPEYVRSKMSACLDQGITTMDQADIYGGYAAEKVLGDALRGTNAKFIRRFGFIEAELAKDGRTPEQSDLAEMDGLWNAAKGAERG